MNNIVIQVIRCIIIVILLKNFLKKNKDVISYYRAFEGFFNVKTSQRGVWLASAFLAGDLLLLSGLVIGKNLMLVCIYGIILQGVFLFRMIMNYGKEFKTNCNCFSLSLPQKVDFKAIGENVLFIYLYIIIVILSHY